VAIVHTRGFRPQLYRESPWYATIAPLLARFDDLARFPTQSELTALHDELVAARGLPALRFVETVKPRKRPQRHLPIDPTTLYEGRILERGEVPTRSDDWHDLFNALAFITFPRAKRALHARQYRVLKSRLPEGALRLPNARTREQDALALFDEGGICIAAAHEVAPELADVDDATLRGWLERGAVRVIPFGHALYEHLVAGLPCPFGAAHVVALPADALRRDDLLDRVDLALSQALADPHAFLVPSEARGNALTNLA